MKLAALFWLAITCQAQSVVLNPDGTITAIAGSDLATKTTCTFLPIADPQSLKVVCQSGSEYTHCGITLAPSTQLPYTRYTAVYTPGGDYVSWTTGEGNWIINAKGKGGFKSLNGAFPVPAAPPTPVDIGTLDALGACQPQAPQFQIVGGSPVRDQNGVLLNPGVMTSGPTANCVLK